MKTKVAAWLLPVVVVLGCGPKGDMGGPAAGARATFHDVSGEEIGEAVLTQEAGSLSIRANLKDLPAGDHGFHIHAAGRCQPPFTTAGGHFNPANKEHGSLNPNGRHAGDLANIPIGGAGTTRIQLTAIELNLEDLFDADGSALVIHAQPDDYRTNPAGNAGDRIACAVIRRP